VDFEAEQDEARAIYTISTQRALALNSEQPTRFVAALLALFLGTLGIHKFYMRRNKQGLSFARLQ
jgi:hypothetical protein